MSEMWQGVIYGGVITLLFFAMSIPVAIWINYRQSIYSEKLDAYITKTKDRRRNIAIRNYAMSLLDARDTTNRVLSFLVMKAAVMIVSLSTGLLCATMAAFFGPNPSGAPPVLQSMLWIATNVSVMTALYSFMRVSQRYVAMRDVAKLRVRLLGSFGVQAVQLAEWAVLKLEDERRQELAVSPDPLSSPI